MQRTRPNSASETGLQYTLLFHGLLNKQNQISDISRGFLVIPRDGKYSQNKNRIGEGSKKSSNSWIEDSSKISDACHF